MEIKHSIQKPLQFQQSKIAERTKTKNVEAKLLSLFLHWLFAGVLGLACWFLL